MFLTKKQSILFNKKKKKKIVLNYLSLFDYLQSLTTKKKIYLR